LKSPIWAIMGWRTMSWMGIGMRSGYIDCKKTKEWKRWRYEWRQEMKKEKREADQALFIAWRKQFSQGHGERKEEGWCERALKGEEKIELSGRIRMLNVRIDCVKCEEQKRGHTKGKKGKGEWGERWRESHSHTRTEI
jgi:hypothetical protein